ncbi:hypothetical protein BU17DRAFT_60036 [Hysterangium stoloniferum]|nr:hypothetical protein BU17DRAFT_60036 [Hysterangium stoloniferum]
MDEEGGPSLKSQVILRFEPVFSQGLKGLRNLGNSGDLASTLQSICTLPAFRIYFPLSFLTQACTCTQQLLAPSIAWLNSSLSRTKAPSLPIFNVSPLAAIPSQSLSEGIIATGKATGKAIVVVD